MINSYCVCLHECHPYPRLNLVTDPLLNPPWTAVLSFFNLVARKLGINILNTQSVFPPVMVIRLTSFVPSAFLFLSLHCTVSLTGSFRKRWETEL